MGNRIVTAVKQRFSIRKLSIGAASVLLGTSLYFMGVSAPVVHAATNGETPASSETSTDSKDPVSVAGQSKYSDVDVNNAIDQYAEKNQDAVNEQEEKEKTGNKVIIRPSDKQPVTVYNTTDRKTQVENIIQKEINDGITKANQNWNKIQEYKKNHNDKQILNGTESDYFENQGLSIGDEKGSEINKITVTDDKDTTKTKDVDTKAVDGETKDIGEITKIADFDGIDITHTSHMTDKEREVMKVNSDNKVIVDFQPAQYQDQDKEIDKEITVTYDNLNNSYYLENINDETNRIKISRIDRTFSSIKVADNPHRFYGGWRGNKYDSYDPCNGPQLIIYKDPSDGFFYNNIEQVSVKDIYYDDKGKQIVFKDGDKNKAWIFVTSLNSDGVGNNNHRGDGKEYVEKVKAENPNDTSADIEKIAGSTVTGPVDENTTKEFTRTVELFDGNSNGDYLRNYLRTNADALKTQGWIWKDNSSELTQTVTLHVKKTDAGYVYDNENAFFKGLKLPSISENGTEKYPDIDEIPEVRVGSKTAVRIRASYSATNSPASKPLDKTEVGVDEEKATDTHEGWWYSDESNSHDQNNYPDWDNKSEDNRYAFVGAVAIQYQPGMTITYGADDNAWGSHWACTQTQVVSSLYTPVIIYDHIKDGYSRSDDVNMTVHYVMDDGSKASSDSKQTASFTESVIQDSVTGKITWTPAASGIQDNVTGKITWTPATSQTFKDVTTPAITGYTPNKDKVAGSTVKFGDKDIEVTVTYSPDKQHMTITYIDDTTGKTLHTDNPEGVSDQDAKYTTKHTIEQFEDQHYKLISDSTNGKDLIFDHDDNVNQTYEVHFVHDTQKVNRKDTVTETINYKFEDGTTAQPTVTQTENFSEDGNKDLVTGKTTWDEATPQTFEDVTTPAITGYTPNKDKVAGSTVKFGDKDIEVTVTYSPDKQHMTITYIDDTTGKTLHTDNPEGVSDQDAKYTTKHTIEQFEDQHYKLISDSTNGKDLIFDHDDNVNQTYEVHFVHDTQKVNRKDTVTETINYKFEDGTTAQPTVTQTENFSEDGNKDLVTGKTTWDEATPQTFEDVTTPAITGYTPNKDKVAGSTVKFGDKDIEVTVTYSPDKQHMTITYIDDTTGKTLHTDNPEGVSDQDAKYTTKHTIEQFEDQHYKLISDSTNGKDLIFDHDDNVNQTYEVHFVHDTQKVNRKDTVTETINYKFEDGTTAQPTVTQTENFSEDGNKDLVTGKTTWDEATPQTFEDVTTPAITGYTPNKDKVAGSTVKFGDKDIEVTVTYSPDKQHMTITYIDDTTGKTLHTDNPEGVSDQDAKYTTKHTIEQFEDQHYKLISDSTNGKDLIFDHDDNVNQTYEVHFVHDTQKVNRKDTVTETINYKFEDGTTAQPTVTQTENFSEDGNKDLVTGKTTWDEATPQTFEDVTTPAITGYTPNKDKVAGSTVKFGDKDIEVTVTYSPDKQHMTITYIDDTTGKTLHTDNPEGVSDQDAKYTTKHTIEQFEDQHYKLISDSTNGKDLIFDHDDNVNQTYEVHFVHDTQKVNRKDTVTETINYKFEDGTTAQPTVTQTENFSEDGNKDLVTGKTTWDEATPQTFEDVTTPAITGYTPNKDKVAGSTVKFGDKDIEVTVTYSPDDQLGHINYIDDNTGKTLARDNFSGKTNGHENYTPTNRIQEFENKGYELVSSDYPDGGFNFDDNDQQEQVFHVHLKHGMVTVTTKKPQTPNTSINPKDPQSPKYPKDINNTNKDVKRTIDYKYSDGKTAQPTVNDSLHFERTVVIDKVTGEVSSDTWTPSQDFNDIQTPAIQGYTPNRTVVSDKNIGHDYQDIVEHVVYSPDKQFGHIDYIDDDTKTTLTTDNFSGNPNEHEDYTPIDRIQKFENKGYELVSNDYPDGGFNFDDNDQQEQVFHVHLKHGMVTVTTKKPQTPNTSINPKDPQSPKYPKDINNTNKDVKRTIDYKYSDGKTAQPTVNDSLHFERTVVIDKVTGEVVSDTWTPSQDFNDVQTPAIPGYTPDKTVVSDKNIGHDHDDIIKHVVYSPDKQHMTITYIDDTTGKTLHTDNPEGVSDQDANYTTKQTIEQFEDQHYKLISDSTNGKDLIFDHDDNVNQTYEVHFVHGTQKVNRKDTVTETIDYKFEDGKTAQPTVTQIENFSEDGTKDLVTGETTWDEATSQTFEDVVTPKMTGYTPDKDKVKGSTVNFGNPDINVTVHYIANDQTAKITYIDDTEKKTLGSDKQNGKFNQVITFEHDPAEVIKGLEEKGYKLVSDNFKPGIKYQNDNKSNNFEVHLVHTYEPVETSQTITETVHYIDANGKPVAPDHVAKVVIKVTGTRDKVTDSITWNTPSTGHFDEVISPVVPNMTPDKKFIPSRDVQYGDSDITESVVYTSDNPTSKTPEKPDKPSKEGSKTPEKPDKPSKEVSKIPEKPDKPSKEVSKIPEKPDKPSKEGSKTPEKPIDSRTVDNHVSAKSTAKRELPQTGATINTGIWTGLVSMIASLGLLGASKKRKKN